MPSRVPTEIRHRLEPVRLLALDVDGVLTSGNLTYGEIGHSGIFLGWLDFEKRSAIVIGYAGENRSMPGRFREYDITRLFGITRGKN